eukprot:6181351-Pleurochrysis_carterae.AAC.5
MKHKRATSVDSDGRTHRAAVAPASSFVRAGTSHLCAAAPALRLRRGKVARRTHARAALVEACPLQDRDVFAAADSSDPFRACATCSFAAALTSVVPRTNGPTRQRTVRARGDGRGAAPRLPSHWQRRRALDASATKCQNRCGLGRARCQIQERNARLRRIDERSIVSNALNERRS